MGDVVLSAGVRQNLLSLQSTAELMSLTQNRLATGKKVNSALDNPTNFFTSQSLSNRARDLNALLDSIGQAQQTIAAADHGITAITKLVESAKAVAKQAQQITQSGATYALAVTGNTAIAADVAAVGTGSIAIAADVAAVGTGSVAIAADTPAVLTGSVGGLTTGTVLNAAPTPLVNGQTITISDGTNTVTHTVADATTETVQDVLNTLNGGAATWTAAINGSGQLEVTSDNATDTLTISGGAGATALFGSTGTSVAPANATLGPLTGILTVQQGSNPAVNVDFSTVTNRAQLLTALGGLGTINGSGNLVLTATNNTDTITVSGTGTSMSGLGLAASYEASNATIGAMTGILTVQQGSNPAINVDFSTVNNRTELLAALGGIASINGSGNLVLTASNATDSIAVTGTGTSVSGLGLAASYAPTNATIGALTGSVSITVGSNPAQTINFGAGNVTNRAQLMTALSGLTGVTATINGSNQISITSTTADTVTIAGTGTGATGLFAAGNIGANVPTATVATPNTARANLQTQFNDLLAQIDGLARDSSYNGVNLLYDDDLIVTFNEDGSSFLNVEGVMFTSIGLGLTAQVASEFQTNTGVEAVLADIDAALSTLRSQATDFGSKLGTVQTRQDFTKKLIQTLETGADNLVLADTNEEGANMLALQTRQQLSTTALSLSAQADQAVLRLFG